VVHVHLLYYLLHLTWTSQRDWPSEQHSAPKTKRKCHKMRKDLDIWKYCRSSAEDKLKLQNLENSCTTSLGVLSIMLRCKESVLLDCFILCVDPIPQQETIIKLLCCIPFLSFPSILLGPQVYTTYFLNCMKHNEYQQFQINLGYYYLNVYLPYPNVFEHVFGFLYLA